MSTYLISIEPLDVWLFRDGRPFSAGDDHHASSYFPPPHSTVQGALRAAYLAANQVDVDAYAARRLPNQTDIEKVIGLPGGAPGFKLGAIYVVKDGKRYLPRPADAYAVPGGLRSLSVGTAPNRVRTNLPPGLSLLWRPQADPADETATAIVPEASLPADDARWVSETALRSYLAEADASKRVITNAELLSDGDLFEREPRFGISLNYSVRRPTQGALYEAEFLRLKSDVRIEVEVEGAGLSEFPNTGLLKMGGEGRMGRYEVRANSTQTAASAEANAAATRRIRVYFATPAVLANGWQGSWDNKLVAAALPRYESRGGFDLAAEVQTRNGTSGAQMHKPARRFIPAGSVYFFEGDVLGSVMPGVLPGVVADDAQIGLGQIILGRW
jgi:CRISPR-associated protein Cmr3